MIGRLETRLQHWLVADETGYPARRGLIGALLAAVTVGAVAALAALLVGFGFPSPETLSILFVIPVLVGAVVDGLRAALLAVLLSVLAYNFVLLAPVWHVGLWEVENFAKLTLLGIVALVASALSGQIRHLVREAIQRERVLAGVYGLSQDMLGIANLAAMRQAATAKLTSLLGCPATIVLREEVAATDAIGQFCLAQNGPVGGGTPHFPDHSDLLLPLSSQATVIGLLRLDAGVRARFAPKILATLSAQTASALEKVRLAEAHEAKQREAEREKFLAALLSSVSHDFRTPLVTVIGTLSSLQDMKPVVDHPDSHAMVGGALEEAQKLNRFITNLMEISRLESGLETIRKEPASLRDLLARALRTLRPLIGQQHFTIDAASDFPQLLVNAALMELVLLNLLENAIKYGPPAGEVKIIARHTAQGATIDIDDDGDGIPPAERNAIFVKFYRARHGDHKVAGTGLGLYICRAIITAHGGTIAAIDPHDGQGACVRLSLPGSLLIPNPPPTENEDV